MTLRGAAAGSDIKGRRGDYRGGALPSQPTAPTTTDNVVYGVDNVVYGVDNVVYES